jgi:sensor histidine kinase YesM
LSAEFERLADYLALMQVRMGPRLAVQLDLPTELRSLVVPPLILQPLVENSIQHGLEPQVQGGRISISARREGPLLVLSVRDTGVGLGATLLGPAPAGTGFGSRHVRQRLTVLYGGRAHFELGAADDSQGGTLACIHLPAFGEAPLASRPL